MVKAKVLCGRVETSSPTLQHDATTLKIPKMVQNNISILRAFENQSKPPAWKGQYSDEYPISGNQVNCIHSEKERLILVL
jgi:hypothetical protein